MIVETTNYHLECDNEKCKNGFGSPMRTSEEEVLKFAKELGGWCIVECLGNHYCQKCARKLIFNLTGYGELVNGNGESVITVKDTDGYRYTENGREFKKLENGEWLEC